VAEFKTDTIVPSVVHGFAAKESWTTDFVNAMNVFATNRDVGATQSTLLQAAQDAGVA
jgi:glucose/mannose transport system substrate-binding protein